MSSSAPPPTRVRTAAGRQVGAGAVLLVVGAVVAFLLVQGGASTLAAVGYLIAVAGLVLIGNGLVLRHRPEGR